MGPSLSKFLTICSQCDTVGSNTDVLANALKFLEGESWYVSRHIALAWIGPDDSIPEVARESLGARLEPSTFSWMPVDWFSNYIWPCSTPSEPNGSSTLLLYVRIHADDSVLRELSG
jgi:hypothetical protein